MYVVGLFVFEVHSDILYFTKYKIGPYILYVGLWAGYITREMKKHCQSSLAVSEASVHCCLHNDVRRNCDSRLVTLRAAALCIVIGPVCGFVCVSEGLLPR